MDRSTFSKILSKDRSPKDKSLEKREQMKREKGEKRKKFIIDRLFDQCTLNGIAGLLLCRLIFNPHHSCICAPLPHPILAPDDADGNGSVNLREFLIGFDYWTTQRGQSPDQKQAMFFKFFDADQSGKMDKGELMDMLLCKSLSGVVARKGPFCSSLPSRHYRIQRFRGTRDTIAARTCFAVYV